MIEQHWRRIAAIHCQDEGDIAAVWLAHDKDADVIHLYDCALFKREVLIVVAEAINARGRWIPVAWKDGSKPIADQLLERGCNMLVDPVKDDPAFAEATSREIWERMRTKRFRVDKRLAEWLDEYRSFYRDESSVPLGTHPLMAATRHAVAQLSWAKRLRPKRKTHRNSPRVAIV